MGEKGGIKLRWLDQPNEKRRVCRDLLEKLPKWFGIPEAREGYMHEVGALSTVAAFDGKQAVGIAALKGHTSAACEIAVIAVHPSYHGRGVGRKLVIALIEFARKSQLRFLTVKTVDASYENEEYANTRAFYRAIGFEPLEVFPDLWGGRVPCLMMVRAL